MTSSNSPGFFSLSTEAGVLRTSIAVTLVVSTAGILFGLLSGSFSITFDGLYSLVDASMSLLALIVVNLINAHTRARNLSVRLKERFSMGFWHLEPMVLALNSVLLIGVAIYALINAISSLMAGGRDLEFGLAIFYAVITVSACAGIALLEARANRKLNSDFIRLDVRSWIMAGGITAALLVAFCIGYAVQGTALEWISPYIDPAVLALVCLVIIPLPVNTLRRALADVFLVTPAELKQQVDEVAQAFVEKHGFASFRSYVARIGRGRQIEVYFILPPDLPARTIEEWDALREEVATALGEKNPDRWLIVTFTGDRSWAE